MDALDLTKAPPRAPRTPLAGLNLIMASRTVDKMRASLPGGNIGAYQIPGFTMRMLDAIGISEEDFRAEVIRASSDAEIADWIRGRTTPEKIAASNAALENRRVKDRLEDEAWRKRYPFAVNKPPETSLIDVLSEDDQLTFYGAR
jgi:hypothetical protein